MNSTNAMPEKSEKRKCVHCTLSGFAPMIVLVDSKRGRKTETIAICANVNACKRRQNVNAKRERERAHAEATARDGAQAR